MFCNLIITFAADFIASALDCGRSCAFGAFGLVRGTMMKHRVPQCDRDAGTRVLSSFGFGERWTDSLTLGPADKNVCD